VSISLFPNIIRFDVREKPQHNGKAIRHYIVNNHD